MGIVSRRYKEHKQIFHFLKSILLRQKTITVLTISGDVMLTLRKYEGFPDNEVINDHDVPSKMWRV